MRFSKASIWVLVLSRTARWASRSFARFLANWSGVRLATPRDPDPDTDARLFRLLGGALDLEAESIGDVVEVLGEAFWSCSCAYA